MKTILKFCKFGFACFILFTLIGCETTPLPVVNDAPPPIGDILKIGDSVTIQFTDVPHPPDYHRENIKEDGTISLPGLSAEKKSIQAAGLTPQKLERAVWDLYVPSMYKRLTVTVTSENRYIYVHGEVVLPNRYQYITEMTVTQVIATAGGFTNFARKNKIILTRKGGHRIEVDCKQALIDSSYDVSVWPGDTITVKRRFF
jgi:polysaccharide export outer membrane protein